MPTLIAWSYAEQLYMQVLTNPVFSEPVGVYQMWHNHFNDVLGHKWFWRLAEQVEEIQDYQLSYLTTIPQGGTLTSLNERPYAASLLTSTV